MRSLHRYLFVCLAILGPLGAQASTTYWVTVDGESPSSIHVRGTFDLESSTVGMYITSSPQLEDGQAALVRNFAARNSTGEAIEPNYAGEGDWLLPGTREGERIEIEYDVLLEHGSYDWRPGIDEVAYRQDDGLFFTGYSLFILPGLASQEPVTVHFDLPEKWRASTPWLRTVSDRTTYEASSLLDLGRNCLFLGRHLEETIAIDGFTFVLAIGGELQEKRSMFVNAMKPVLPAYVEMFGGMPLATRYLVVINSSERSDGGAFLGSYSLLIQGEVNSASQAIWGHGIAHELAHFWNGHAIAPASESEEEWFKEGFTDYLTLIQLSRSGLDPWPVTSRKLENMVRRYVVARRLMGQNDSLRAAGAEKHRKRFLVYGGGALFALALDVEIRQATENRRGFDDLMQAMYREFGASRTAYTYADIVRIATEVSGRNQSDLFDRHVAGSEFLNITPTLQAVGLSLATMVDEFYISARNDSTAPERAMARSIFGQRLFDSQ